MQITLIQPNIVWANPSANRQKMEEAIRRAPQSDLYVLPEMWSTGFVTSPQEAQAADGTPVAETEQGATLAWMKHTAQRTNAALAGSLCIQEGDGRYRNRMYFVTPNRLLSYDKHHLFTYGGEQVSYTPGGERTLVEWRGVRFLLQVCYDLRFPIFSRNAIEADQRATYDCILYVASWPASRIEAWRTLLKARAIENQCYVCGVNRIGTDPVCAYSGGTSFIDPYGRCTQEIPQQTEGTLTAQLDLDFLTAFRKKFPVLMDRD